MKAAGIAIPIILFFLWLPRLLESSVSRSRIRIAAAERGSIIATITGSGTVTPEREHVITSPFESRVIRVLLEPGTSLSPGDRILEMDLNEAENEKNNLERQIELKKNEKAKLELDYRTKLNDLTSQIGIKELNLDVLKSKSEQQDKLYKMGLTPREAVTIAKMEEGIAGIELEKLRNSLELEKETHANRIGSLETEIRQLEADTYELERKLRIAETRTDRAGVLTWVIEEQGASIGRGEIIARIADLSSYEVRANISDIHASKLRVGQNVLVRTDDFELPGSISAILPTIENGILTFKVSLGDGKSDPHLRSNLRVDVYVITGQKDNTIRVKRGPFAGGEGGEEVFVVQGDYAEKRNVRIGLTSFDYVEIVEGIEPGEEIIISDMSEYRYLNRVTIKE